MLAKNIIDTRLFEWAEVLRKERNIGAHTTEDETSREDAKDVLDFGIALCEYIYVLDQKYREFGERKVKKAKAKVEAEAKAKARAEAKAKATAAAAAKEKDTF